MLEDPASHTSGMAVSEDAQETALEDDRSRFCQRFGCSRVTAGGDNIPDPHELTFLHRLM